LAPKILPQLQQILGIQALTGKGLYTLESFFACGINAYKNSIHDGWVAISLDENEYEKNGLYDDFSYSILRKVIWPAMASHNWIDIKPHHAYYDGQEGRRTCYRFTTHAINLIYQIEEQIDQIPQIDQLAGLSICKYRNYPDPTKNNKIVPQSILPNHIRLALDQSEQKLEVINQYNKKINKEMAGPGIDKPQQYTQIGFWDGQTYTPGRIYSDASFVPAKIRNTQWTIKNQNIAELDLKSSHVALMYAAKGLILQNDAYDIPTYPKETREFIKFVTQCMINADSKKNAIKAIKSKMQKKGKYKKTSTKLSIWESYTYSIIEKNQKLKQIIKLCNRIGISTDQLINNWNSDIKENIQICKKYYKDASKAMAGFLWLLARDLGKQRDWPEHISVDHKVDYILHKLGNHHIINENKIGKANFVFDKIIQSVDSIDNRQLDQQRPVSNLSTDQLVSIDDINNNQILRQDIDNNKDNRLLRPASNQSIDQSTTNTKTVHNLDDLPNSNTNIYIYPINPISLLIDTELVIACIQTLFWLFFDDFLAEMYSAIKEHHSPIKDLFAVDIGIHLQAIEGLVAIDVLHLCALQDIPAINIHDGFYCAESNSDAVHHIIEMVLLRQPSTPRVTIIKTTHTTTLAQ
jgi:hypothetical protein